MKKKTRRERKKKITNKSSKGLRLRKTVRAKIISQDIVQINMKVLKEGNKKLLEIFPDQCQGKVKENRAFKRKQKKEEPKVEEVKSEEFDIGEFVSFAEDIANAMEGTPQQFAEDLAASAKGGNQDMQMLLLFLSTVTYDQLMALATPYEQSDGLLQYINKLRDNKEWVEKALITIRGV